MKYINTVDFGFIIFNELIEHKMIADRMRLEPDDIISAGFVNIGNDPQCHGKSVSLNKKSDPEDTKNMIRQIFLS